MRCARCMFKHLRHRGIECTSGVGSTPTCSHPIKENSQLSEFHPRSYIFYDYNQSIVKSCTDSNIACCVMTRVIAHKPEKNMIVVDCGFTALSHDGKFQRLPNNDFCLIQNENNLRFFYMSQETAMIVAKEGDLDCKQYPVGTVLYIYLYRVNSSACLHSVYCVHCGDDVIDTWTPVKGW